MTKSDSSEEYQTRRYSIESGVVRMPIKYGNEIADGSNLNYEICIVGAGAVGITLAKELYKGGKSVVVLESGIENRYMGRDQTPRNDDLRVMELDEGKTNPFIVKARPNFLTSSRTRCYGGSTNCWGGWIRPLDPYDMKDWPIQYSDLPYSDAMKLVQLQNFEDFDDPAIWIKRLQPYTAPADERAVFDADKLNKSGLKSVVIQQQTDEVYLNFQWQHGWIFEDKTGNITLIRNATATEFDEVTGDIDSRFSKLTCGALDLSTGKKGKQFYISAQRYVLALGGLETTRFLLLNQDKFKSSRALNNQNIGKYYMNHPKVSNCLKARIPLDQPAKAIQFNNFYGTASPIYERRNCHIQAFVVPTEQSIDKKNGPLNFRLQAALLTSPNKDGYPIIAEINFEQSLNEKSVISIPKDDNDVDLFGKRKLKIDWNFTDVDQKTYTRAIDNFEKFLINEMGGKVTELKKWDEVNNWPPLPKDPDDREFYTGDHHIGTTRMSKSDLSGVVDTTGRVYQSVNLFICSSSVFPSGGWANSTLTLLALTIRMARWLSS